MQSAEPLGSLKKKLGSLKKKMDAYEFFYQIECSPWGRRGVAARPALEREDQDLGPRDYGSQLSRLSRPEGAVRLSTQPFAINSTSSDLKEVGEVRVWALKRT
jgi:hypothetical protein